MLLGGRCITLFLGRRKSKLGAGGTWKIKRRRKNGVGAGLLKRGREAGTFPIQFFQGLSFLHLEITLPFAKLCYVFEEKSFFLPP